jgi:DNA-binding response OmpR family regulator
MMEMPIILVVEDDRDVHLLIEAALNDAGFEVAVARSGEEAVTLLRGRLTAYRAVVADINLLGRINGWQVARVAREVDPEFPVVYTSGAVGDEWAIQGVPNSVMLQKPFAPAQLLTALSELLNRHSPSG